MSLTLSDTPERDSLISVYQMVRQRTEELCEPLAPDDYQIQSIVQTSPPKWHLAHVSWLFEAFILSRFQPGYAPFNAEYDYLFNSYYYTHGAMHPRAQRGLLSRPTVDEIYHYRAHVDRKMWDLLNGTGEAAWQELAYYVTLGLNHEEQHQELMLMDIKRNFSANPLMPAYCTGLPAPTGNARQMRWLERGGGLHQIGAAGKAFAFDNESPRHDVLLRDHRLADRFITNAEYLDFINDGGYAEPALWLSDGWALIRSEGWRHPLYWQECDGEWRQFTLGGSRNLNPNEPVCHLSFYEADAYARWAGKRLPLEEELETLLAEQPVVGNFLQSGLLHPAPAMQTLQAFGDLWAWTASPYTPYPGFEPLAGAVGEYNGKFMANQMVLKGGSCITHSGHIRASYRNFFYPAERWAFTGLRLAE